MAYGFKKNIFHTKRPDSEFRNQKYVATGLIILIAAGCTGPNTASIASFGQTATKAIAIMDDAVSIQNELRHEDIVLAEACRYLNGRKYSLSRQPDSATLQIIADRAVFTKALAEYTKALATADDPKGVADLRKAAAALAQAAGNTASIASAGSPIGLAAGPVLKIMINGIVELDELKRRRQIVRIARKMDDVVLSIHQRIINDQDTIDAFLSARLSDWETSAQCVLRRVKSRDAAAYELFRKFDLTNRAYRARLDKIKNSPELYRGIHQAHHSMVETKAEFDETIVQLQVFVSELEALSKLLEKI